MSIYTWKIDPVQTVQDFEKATLDPGPTSSLILSAIFVVDSLYYLMEIVVEDMNSACRNQPHNPATKDVAHTRWATGSSITALDLCAAAIARHLQLKTKANHEFDLRELSKEKRALSAHVIAWLDSIENDVRYQTLLDARNPLTHAVVNRHFRSTGPNDMTLEISKLRFTPYELVVMSKEFATEKVEEFLFLILKLSNIASK